MKKNLMFLMAACLTLTSGEVLAKTIFCTVQKNQSQVSNVSFQHPVTQDGSLDSYFDQLTVSVNGQDQIFKADAANAITGISLRAKTSIFKSSTGVASVRYRFYTIPGQENLNGWSVRNGVEAKLILSSVNEELTLDCVRQ